MRRFFRTRDYQPNPDLDIQEELESHLSLKVDELMASGLQEEEAWTEARRCFGDFDRIREEAASEARGRQRRRSFHDRFDTLTQDVRYALRRMARSPGFTAAAILSLAIGIGANTAVFSVVNAVLLQPLPFPASEELVRIYTSYPGLSPWGSSAYPDYLEVKELDEVFVEVGAFYDIVAPITIREDPQMAMVEAVSSNYLPLLGVQPALGRGFLPEEDVEPGRNPVAILGHGLWTRSFGGDPGVLGRTLRIGGRPYEVVGATPEWFGSGTLNSLEADVFVPVTMASQIEGGQTTRLYAQRTLRTFNIQGRLQPGRTVEEARTRLQLLAAQLQEAYPESNQDRSYRILAAEEVIASPEIDQGLPFVAAFLMAVVGLVLLLACTNLATFLLAQGIHRGREIAVRLALGARRGRLVRQLLSETLLLGLLGGGAGLLMASWTLSLLLGLLPSLPANVTLDLGMDWRVLLFTLFLSAGAGILLGLLPALRSTRPDITPTLKHDAPPQGRRRLSLQSGLVALQMTVSVVLLVGGGLFVRALLVAEKIDPGFSTSNIGVAWLELAMSGLQRDQWEVTEAELVDRLKADPGIESAATASQVPLALGTSFQLFTIPGVEPPAGQDGHKILYSQVSPGFFSTMGIPILAGRGLTPDDRSGAPDAVVVSQALAQAFWPGENPLGKQILRSGAERAATVVGVAADTKIERLGEDPMPFLYFARNQYPTSHLRVVAKGRELAGDPVSTLRQVIREVNPNFALMEVKSMEDHLSLRLFPSRVAALLLGAFGLLALVLAAIGLYGVVNFAVSRRTREMGIRMSLGADQGAVAATMIKGAMAVVAFGGILGLAVAYALARIIQGFLFGIRAGDPLVMIIVPILLGGVALAAAFVPARRATRVDPVEALRSE